MLLDSLNETALGRVFGTGWFNKERIGLLLTCPVFYGVRAAFLFLILQTSAEVCLGCSPCCSTSHPSVITFYWHGKHAQHATH